MQLNKQYHRKALLSSFHLNGLTLGFHPQTQKLGEANVHKGLEKGPVQSSGQVDFCVRQVTFPTHLPNGQGYGQAARELS